jgi:beta-glucosidase
VERKTLTDNWNTVREDVFNKYYTKFGAFNYGIGGDSTREILWRLDHKEINGLKLKLFFVNDWN